MCKATTFDVTKPFQHDAISHLVHAYWFKQRNTEVKVPEERFSTVPDNLIALTCNAVCLPNLLLRGSMLTKSKLEAALRDYIRSDTDVNHFSNATYAPK